jgi:hypothetical protein
VPSCSSNRAKHLLASSSSRAHGVVVSHPLRMRKALGSIPSVSTLPMVAKFRNNMSSSETCMRTCARPWPGEQNCCYHLWHMECNLCRSRDSAGGHDSSVRSCKRFGWLMHKAFFWLWQSQELLLEHASHGPYRLVVRTSRCGRDNPGSTPGGDICRSPSLIELMNGLHFTHVTIIAKASICNDCLIWSNSVVQLGKLVFLGCSSSYIFMPRPNCFHIRAPVV